MRWASAFSSLGDLKADEKQLEDCLRRLRGFMLETKPEEVIGAFCTRPDHTRALHGLLRSIEHVGFLMPLQLSLDAVERAARAAGFSQNHGVFASVLIAQELGLRLSVPTVPTTVFRASARRDDREAFGVELFRPDVDETVSAAWIREGVGRHCAFSLVNGEDATFATVIEIFETLGFRVPSFLPARPCRLPLEDGRTLRNVYFDGSVGDFLGRVEVVHVA
jgi:hypothetical protein